MHLRRRRGLVAAVTAAALGTAVAFAAVGWSGPPTSTAAAPEAPTTPATGTPAPGSPGTVPVDHPSRASTSPASTSPASTSPASSSTSPGASSPGASSRPQTPLWQPQEPIGLDGPAIDVLKGAPAGEPVRIVVLSTDEQGRPQVDVTRAADTDAAVASIEEARTDPATVAISVDTRVAAVPETPDEYRSLQWSMDRLKAEDAWRLHSGAGQTVAVIDSGVDGTHPDLAARVLPGVDIIYGGDGRTDPHGHGTHVAGIISAIANNGIGVAGLADGAAILPVRVLDSDGSGWNSDVAAGIIWATDHGAKVLNMSLASSANDPTLASAVRYAQNRDVVVVAAAGNYRQSGNRPQYPAAFPGVVAVAATDDTDATADFSETGSYVTIAAPGVDIPSTYPVAFGSYAYMSGTSMAAPYVAAATALVRAAAPALAATAVIDDLVKTADDRGAPGRDDEFGAGILNPVAAMQAVLPAPQPPATTTTTLELPVTPVASGAATTLTATVRTASGSAVTGPVTFCSRAVGGPDLCGRPVTADATGQATTTMTLAEDADIWARFAGTSGATASTSAYKRLSVTGVVTTTSLALSSTQVNAGAPVTITATVRTPGGAPVNGALMFCSRPVGGAVDCGRSVTLDGKGAATRQLTPTAPTDVWTTYLGTPSKKASTSAYKRIDVVGVATTTTIGLSATQVNAGAPVTITATVRSADGTAANGAVIFCSHAVGGPDVCGRPVDLANGGASTSLTPQAHSDVWIRYLGTPSKKASSSAYKRINVAPAVKVTGGTHALTVSVNPARAQQVTVQRNANGSWVTVSNRPASSAAAFTVTGLAPGSYRVVVAGTAQLLSVTTTAVTVR